jgi:hypothetical protein
MKKLSLLARRLVLVWGFAAGCGGGAAGGAPVDPVDVGSPTEPGDTAALVAQLQLDMTRLNDLQLVSAHSLVVMGAERSSCYGLHPCASSASDPIVAAEYARQAPRLHALVALAEEVESAERYPSAATDTAADLAALNGLAIVELTGLIKAQPATGQTCYGLPCPADIVARADQENQRRADAAHVLASEATQSGL